MKKEVPEEPAEEAPVQVGEGAEAVPEAPARRFMVLAEANGAGVLAVAAVANSNGRQPEPEKEVAPEPSEAPKTPFLRVFCHLIVELGPDAVRCFTKNGIQMEMIKGVILLSDDRGCRVRVLEARFVLERSPSPEVRKFPGGFKRP